MASLIFSIASSKVSPWLWQPGRAGQCTSKPYSVLFITTLYFMIKLYHIYHLLSKTIESYHWDIWLNTGYGFSDTNLKWVIPIGWAIRNNVKGK